MAQYQRPPSNPGFQSPVQQNVQLSAPPANNGNPNGVYNNAPGNPNQGMGGTNMNQLPSWMRRNGEVRGPVNYNGQHADLGRYVAPQMDPNGNPVARDQSPYAYNLPNNYGRAFNYEGGLSMVGQNRSAFDPRGGQSAYLDSLRQMFATMSNEDPQMSQPTGGLPQSSLNAQGTLNSLSGSNGVVAQPTGGYEGPKDPSMAYAKPMFQTSKPPAWMNGTRDTRDDRTRANQKPNVPNPTVNGSQSFADLMRSLGMGG